MTRHWARRLVRTLVLAAVVLTVVSLWVQGRFSRMSAAAPSGGLPVQLGEGAHRVEGRMYQAGSGGGGGPLIVVLHGDAPGRKPVYQYTFAAALHTLTGARVLALLRPGYADPFGGRSAGSRGLFAVGDTYTPAAEEELASAIAEAKQQSGATQVVLVGHSGGAVLAANIAALHKGLVQSVVLVSCPCEVPAFRRHMALKQWNPLWLWPVQSVSPLQTLPAMSREVSVVLISGENDQVALPDYSVQYATAARSRGIDAHLVTIPGKGHEILLDPEVLEVVRKEAQL